MIRPLPSRRGLRSGRASRSALAGAALAAAALLVAAPLQNAPAAAEKADGSSSESQKNDAPADALQRLKRAAEKERAGEPKQLRRGLAPPKLLRDAEARLQPLTGDKLKRAARPFEQVLRELPTPEYLQGGRNAGEGAGEQKPAPEGDGKKGANQADRAGADRPPAEAVRAYVHGRAAYRDGDHWKAVDRLERARKLDPDSHDILRLLGTVYFARGDDVRGAQRLKDALRIKPDDPRSLFLLGRFAFEKGRWGEAIVLLGRSARVEDRKGDPAIKYLRPYYLGQALMERGDLNAAVRELRQYLRMPEQFGRTTRLVREIAFLRRQRGPVRVQMADALMRLGRPAEAMKAYNRAQGQQGVDPQMLLTRRVYAMLVMGRSASAQWALLDRLRAGEPSDQLLALVPYVAEHAGRRQRFAELVERVYRGSGRPAPLALAVAELLDGEAATDFLADHLSDRPEDLSVYRTLVDRLAGRRSPLLVRTILRMIRARPATARQYTRVLLDGRADPDKLLTALSELPKERRSSAEAWYLRGAIHESRGDLRRAVDAYDKALEADEQFLSPHLAVAELQLRLGNHAKALELLRRVPNPDDPAARHAKARALMGQGKLDPADRIINELLNEHPKKVDYRLLRAKLQMRRRDFSAAEQTLWSILDYDPTNKRAYRTLFSLFEQNPQSDPEQWVRLMKRVQRQIPDSRIAKLKMAEWYVANRKYGEAEKTLRDLVEDNPGDHQALARLVQVLGRDDRWGEAKKLLLEKIEQRPDDAGLVSLLRSVAQKLDNMELYYKQRERQLKRQEDSLDKWVGLAQLYERWGKRDQAVASLEEAVQKKDERAPQARLYLSQLYRQAERHEDALRQLDKALEAGPDSPAQYHYAKALIHHQMDQREKAERSLLAALKANPDHPPANNDLGYRWAEQGRNLERALKMTRKAVEAEPDNGAYLDSLAWVHYKLGDFRKAAERLSEAREKRSGRDPVILDHLGDALWRIGNEQRARKVWREARDMAERMDPSRRPNLPELRKRLERKIGAVANDEEPSIAPIPGEQGAKSEAPKDQKNADQAGGAGGGSQKQVNKPDKPKPETTDKQPQHDD